MMVAHPLHWQRSSMGLFVRLYHTIDGELVELGDVTRGVDGLVFTSRYKRQLNTHELWQIMTFMIDHKYHRPDEIPTTHYDIEVHPA